MEYIEIDEDYGGASGYVVATDREQIGNYLADHSGKAGAIADWFKANCKHVAILKNLNVEEGKRGNGYGNEMLENFLAEAEACEANAILLISDSSESQANGFVLDDWYNGYDFVAVAPTVAGTLMVYPARIGRRLKKFAFPKPPKTKTCECAPFPMQSLNHRPATL